MLWVVKKEHSFIERISVLLNELIRYDKVCIKDNKKYIVSENDYIIKNPRVNIHTMDCTKSVLPNALLISLKTFTFYYEIVVFFRLSFLLCFKFVS